MTDVNNGSGQPSTAEDSNGKPPTGQPAPSVTPEPSSTPPVDPAEQARRDQQSKKDKAVAEKGDIEQEVDWLRAREMERVRDESVKSFLSENGKDYPNVKPDDPLFKYASSDDDIKSIAADLQSRFMGMQQDALASVQEGGPTPLTQEQYDKELKDLEVQTSKSGQSSFGSFIDKTRRLNRK